MDVLTDKAGRMLMAGALGGLQKKLDDMDLPSNLLEQIVEMKREFEQAMVQPPEVAKKDLSALAGELGVVLSEDESHEADLQKDESVDGT